MSEPESIRTYPRLRRSVGNAKAMCYKLTGRVGELPYTRPFPSPTTDSVGLIKTRRFLSGQQMADSGGTWQIGVIGRRKKASRSKQVKNIQKYRSLPDTHTSRIAKGCPPRCEKVIKSESCTKARPLPVHNVHYPAVLAQMVRSPGIPTHLTLQRQETVPTTTKDYQSPTRGISHFRPSRKGTLMRRPFFPTFHLHRHRHYPQPVPSSRPLCRRVVLNYSNHSCLTI